MREPLVPGRVIKYWDATCMGHGTIEIFLPIKTVSEANCSEHWSKKSSRHKRQQKALRAYLSHIKAYPLPCIITWHRVGAKLLDSWDGLPMAFKWLTDELSDMILGNIYATPKKVLNSSPNAILLQKRIRGQNDNDPRLEWRYTQSVGKVHGTWLTIEPPIAETPMSWKEDCQARTIFEDGTIFESHKKVDIKTTG